MNLDFLKNKETWKTVGNVSVRFGKAIVIDGLKAQALKGAKAAITTGFDSGMDGIKKLTVDDILGEEKPKTPKTKKNWFPLGKKKDKIEEILEDVKEHPIDWKDANDEKIEVFEGEIIDAK